MTKKEKFLKLVSSTDKELPKQINSRSVNAETLKESKRIAMKVLIRIDDLGWKQNVLAEKLKVSPQHISKMLKGEENFTLDTIVKLQRTLNIPLLAGAEESRDSHYEILAECNQKVGFFGKSAAIFSYNAESRWFSKKLKADQELEAGKNLII